MDDKTARLIEDIFTAQVLLLAKQLKAEKEKKGVTSTSDYIADAARLIKETRGRVLSTA